MVTVDEPAVVGVPDTSPAADNVRPAGKLPLVTENVYGAVPPLAVNCCEYAVPITPFGSTAGETVITGQAAGEITCA